MELTVTARCQLCHRRLPLAEFERRGGNGFTKACRECRDAIGERECGRYDRYFDGTEHDRDVTARLRETALARGFER